MSFLYIWQTLFQGPLSIASGALGFATYSRYLSEKSYRLSAILGFLGTHGDNVIAGAIVLLVVVLLYRRITEIGQISVVFSVIVVGTILWIVWGGATHFDAHRVFDSVGGNGICRGCFSRRWATASVQTVYSYLGYYNVCNLGGEMKDPQRNIPRAIFISILGITVLYLAMQTSILSVMPWQGSGENDSSSSARLSSACTGASGRRLQRG